MKVKVFRKKLKSILFIIQISNFKMSIYRFKLSEQLLERMKVFADIHALDDLHQFKESFEEWYHHSDNKTMIQQETYRLEQLGYKGDIKGKIFKSVRYYFRKKPKTTKEKTERKKEFYISTELFGYMDRVIENQHTKKPSDLFDQFLERYQSFPDVQEYLEKDTLKVKKSFKNRMFKHKHNMVN